MNKINYLIIAGALFASSCASKNESITNKIISVDYPETKKQTDTIDNYHGTEIADPYRWLEDDNADDTKAWVVDQNKVTEGYLSQIPYRGKIKDRLEKLWNYEKYSSPFKEGGKYYYFKNDGLQNQSVLYVSDDILQEGKVALDPNKFSDDGTASLGAMSFDKSGRYLAYAISEGGSDWRTAYVKDMETGKMLDDKVEWIKFSGLAWYKDGFFYSKYPTPKDGDELSAKNEYHKVYYHKLGTAQSDDVLIFETPDHAQRNCYASTTDSEDYLIISTSESTSGNGLYVADLNKSMKDIRPIVTTFDSDYSVIDSDGSKLLVITNNEAPKQKIISIDANAPQKANWKTVVAENEDALRGASIVGGRLFVNYMHNASSKINVHDLDGKFQSELKLPGIGNSGGISGKKSDELGFYSFTSFTRPSTIYALDTKSLKSEIFRQPKVDFDSDAYETVQKWFTSKDGTKVPMFITMKKGTKLDGNNPTLLYGYGGFNIPLLPSFSISRLPLLENGGIYVVANIRGGGEFGKDWHKAGTQGQKQNVFDDFIGAGEYLVENGYTSKDKLAIQGGSNGGLLVGACMTQRPDLFAVAFPAVGVLDMLRYHKFTIGWAWAGDYGRSDDPEAFDYLVKYSPLHNVKPVAYPATMVTTADHDDRVVPAHSFKFISELQDKHVGDNPVLIRIETSAGHGAGKPTSKQIEEAADILSFMLYNTNETYPTTVKG